MLERDVLEHAFRLIEPVDHWTRQASARDHQGRKVAPEAPEACCWCPVGAIEKIVVDHGLDDEVMFSAIRRLCHAAKALFGTRVVNVVNDRRGHEAALASFRHAIDHCKIVEAAGVDDDFAETERLRTALGFCLGYIDQLERGLHQRQSTNAQLDTVIAHIKQTMGLAEFGLAADTLQFPPH